MQRKAITFQVAMLGITMVLGMLLKTEMFTSARMVHRNASILTLVTTLVTMIIIVSQKASRMAVGLVITAFIATLAASAGGNLTRTSRHDLGYGLMLASFTVATIASVTAMAVIYRQKSEN